jgi:hypothetical protein
MVANIRPRRLVRKMHREQRDSGEYVPPLLLRGNRSPSFWHRKSSGLRIACHRLVAQPSNDETGTRQELPRTYSVVPWVGLDFSRPPRPTNGLFSGRFGLATNYCAATKLSSAIQAGMGPHASIRPNQLDRLYPRGLNQPPTCTRGYLVSGKLAEEIRKNLVTK